jgi:hypothetical protein
MINARLRDSQRAIERSGRAVRELNLSLAAL